ncbi:MAG: hypothetical protein HY931_02175 [Candidatus Falkowbacteria bacterium]|nr:MAG: hypothetical protein HY931_02175 [Candidatus Falkowbacteria bacterium]
MLKISIFSFLIGMAVYAGTAAILGKKKANRLPGGAIGGSLALTWVILPAYWYLAIIFSLIGHIVAVLVTKWFQRIVAVRNFR